jgi:hypothetical protein
MVGLHIPNHLASTARGRKKLDKKRSINRIVTVVTVIAKAIASQHPYVKYLSQLHLILYSLKSRCCLNFKGGIYWKLQLLIVDFVIDF